MAILIAFMLAVITYYINNRLQRIIQIKIAINSLFKMFGESNVNKCDYKASIACDILLQEILRIENLYDINPYIEKEIKKLKKLRLLYKAQFNKGNIYSFDNDFIDQIKALDYTYLDKNFIIISFLNFKLKSN